MFPDGARPEAAGVETVRGSSKQFVARVGIDKPYRCFEQRRSLN